jgi:aminoglycoside 2''-phosphotransferase
MVPQSGDIQRILHAYPDLAIQRIGALGQGQYNDVLLINEELVFRFPRYPAALADMGREVSLLPRLRGCLPLAIPDPIYVALEGHDVSSAFIGYRLLPGEPMTQEALRAVTDEATRSQLAQQLTGFLRALHAVPPKRCTEPLRVVAGYPAWVEMFARFRQQLFPRMRPEARRAVAEGFERYLGDAGNAAIRPVLVHGDFGTGNILYDAERGTITGILDWTSAGLGDPAVDLAALICAVGYGEAFVHLGFPVYPELEAMLPRARFYTSTFALQEALFGLESGDEAAFERGIAGYR